MNGRREMSERGRARSAKIARGRGDEDTGRMVKIRRRIAVDVVVGGDLQRDLVA